MNILTAVVLVAGSAGLLATSLVPDVSDLEQRDERAAARLRELAVRGAREAQEKGDTQAAQFYRNMAVSLVQSRG